MRARHALDTRDAENSEEGGRNDRTIHDNSAGSSVRKSRASVGVRTECSVRRTGRVE
jgi:hypothetical protein